MMTTSSIESVLCDKDSCLRFHKYLKDNYQADYLEFWLRAENFRYIADASERKDLAAKIYAIFFRDSSPKCLAIDHAFTEGLDLEMAVARKEVFVKAQRAAYIQLSQACSRFLAKDTASPSKKDKESKKKHKRKGLLSAVSHSSSVSPSSSPADDMEKLIDRHLQRSKGETEDTGDGSKPRTSSLAGSQGLTVGFLSLITAEEDPVSDVASPAGFLSFTQNSAEFDVEGSPSLSTSSKRKKEKKPKKKKKRDDTGERALRTAFRELFLTPPFFLSTKLLQIAIAEDEGAVEPLGEAVVDLFLVNDKMTHLLEVIFQSELETYKGVTQNTVLFRTDSGATTLMTKYLSKRAGKYLKKIVAPALERVMQHPDGLEVNPVKDPEADVDANSDIILVLVQDVFDTIITSITNLPWDVLKVLATIYSMVESAFSEAIGFQVIGSLLFLRFICPSLVTPERYGITSDSMSIPCRRAVVLVSKLLQNLVNGVEADGTKEAYMTKLNSFLCESNKAKLLEFYRSIVSVPDDSAAQANVLEQVRRLDSLSTAKMLFLRQYLVEHLDGVWSCSLEQTELATNFFPFIRAGLAITSDGPGVSRRT